MKHRSAALRIAGALLAAGLTTALASQARATVTWSFFETGISCLSGDCALPPQPFIFATFTLPGPISSGTARFQGGGPGSLPPVYTGDEFFFSVVGGVGGLRLSPAFQGTPNCFLGGGPGTICDFDVSWSATATQLAISIAFDTIFDNIGGQAGGPFGSFGGRVATDSPFLGGCNIFALGCVIIGFWQSDLAVPEPSSASLILAGLFGVWLTRRNQSPYHAYCGSLGRGAA
jgi:hypothetical protein